MNKSTHLKCIVVILLLVLISHTQISLAAGNEQSGFQEFNDQNWQVLYKENFDSNFVARDGLKFGSDNWLTFQLLNGGEIEVVNGYAQVNAPEFWHAALIRSSKILPPEYKIRTKIGYINYDLSNYEQEDYDHPDFNDHSGHYENGMYFLTVTNDTCSGNQCAEEWWHYHRKMVIDIDNHIDWDTDEEINHPLYMVYMAPEVNSGGNLLRTWDGNTWDTSSWNWNVAYTYAYDTWYYAELEKRDSKIILRLYDEDQNLIEETAPVDIDLVHAMDDTVEYLYLGEPHTDDYEGDVRMDEITLLIPGEGVNRLEDLATSTVPSRFFLGDNYPNPFNPKTIITYEIPFTNYIELSIYNILGEKTTTLVSKMQEAGSYKVEWNASEFPSGVYYYRLFSGDNVDIKKMILLK